MSVQHLCRDQSSGTEEGDGEEQVNHDKHLGQLPGAVERASYIHECRDTEPDRVGEDNGLVRGRWFQVARGPVQGSDPEKRAAESSE